MPSTFQSLAHSGTNAVFVNDIGLIVVSDVPTPTPTPTPIPADEAARVTYLGIAGADRIAVEPSGSDDGGRPIFLPPGPGDTIVAARVRDIGGGTGEISEIVIRR